MDDKKKVIDPLPDSFASEEEAGEFWDTHSTEDYTEYFVTVDDKINITHRVFEVCVSEEVFRKLQNKPSRHTDRYRKQPTKFFERN